MDFVGSKGDWCSTDFRFLQTNVACMSILIIGTAALCLRLRRENSFLWFFIKVKRVTDFPLELAVRGVGATRGREADVGP